MADIGNTVAKTVVWIVDRQRLDFYCLQETRWKGEGAMMLGEYIVQDLVKVAAELGLWFLV